MNVGGRGVGWSWGIPGFRVGVSGSGQRWFSIGIPGTGLLFYKVLGRSAPATPYQSVPDEVSGPIGRSSSPPTAPPAPRSTRMKWRNMRRG